uniref:Uncharacterized protein n=1 Tax=Arundo donax TaxID=35708 RepID=A0A0A9DRN8_ARUDO
MERRQCRWSLRRPAYELLQEPDVEDIMNTCSSRQSQPERTSFTWTIT